MSLASFTGLAFAWLQAPSVGGPQDHGSDRGLPGIPRRRRGGPAQCAEPAGQDAGAVRAFPAVRGRARRRERLGASALPACWRPPVRVLQPPTPGTSASRDFTSDPAGFRQLISAAICHSDHRIGIDGARIERQRQRFGGGRVAAVVGRWRRRWRRIGLVSWSRFNCSSSCPAMTKSMISKSTGHDLRNACAERHARRIVLHVARETFGGVARRGEVAHELGFGILGDAELAAQLAVGRDCGARESDEGRDQKSVVCWRSAAARRRR